MSYWDFTIKFQGSQEDVDELFQILRKEREDGTLEYSYLIKESFTPFEIIGKIISITANTLTILKALDYFYQKDKEKKKLSIIIDEKELDFNNSSINDIELVLGKPKLVKYIASVCVPEIESEELIKCARTLIDRPIYYLEKEITDGRIYFSDYNDKTGKIDIILHIKNSEINELLEKKKLYCYPKIESIWKETPFIRPIFTSLELHTKQKRHYGEIKPIKN